MRRSELAIETFKDGHNCAQSVLHSFHSELDIAPEMAFKMAAGFGAGMARTQHCCGAVTGAILVLNILYGEDMAHVYEKINEIMDLFNKKFGTVQCRSLLDDCNLKTPEGQERFKSEEMIKRCHNFVEEIVESLEVMISPAL